MARIPSRLPPTWLPTAKVRGKSNRPQKTGRNRRCREHPRVDLPADVADERRGVVGWIGRLPEAERSLSDLLARQPQSYRARLTLGALLQARGALSEAEEQLRYAVSVGMHHGVLLVQAGFIRYYWNLSLVRESDR